MTIRNAKQAFRDYFANNADDEIVKSNVGMDRQIDDRAYHKLSGPGVAEIFINLLTDDKVEFYVYGSINANARDGLLYKIKSEKTDPTQWDFGENVSVKWGPNTNNGNGGSGKGHVLDVSTGLSWKNLEQDENNLIKNKACSIYSQLWKAINRLFPLADRRVRRSASNREKKLFYNLIVFGAPGTGKSHYLDDLRGKKMKDVIGDSNSDESYFAHYERVTFYPTYSYAQFVGSYKPVMKAVDKNGIELGPTKKDKRTRKAIAYEFVPGPFLRILKDALRNKEKNYLLIIEEINRANAAAVFGDVFQLLDRDDEGNSEYSITPSREMIEYLERKDDNGKDGVPESQARELRMSSNLYIWATMNSADQGVFPLDTAFKRRWDFEYKPLDPKDREQKEMDQVDVEVGVNCKCSWGKIRQAINGLLKRNYVNEDKLLSFSFVRADGNKGGKNFISSRRFKMKVLMYLWEDAARMCRRNVFAEGLGTFSDLIKEWDSVKYSEEDDDILKKVFQFNSSNKIEQLQFTQRESETVSENPEEEKDARNEGIRQEQPTEGTSANGPDTENDDEIKADAEEVEDAAAGPKKPAAQEAENLPNGIKEPVAPDVAPEGQVQKDETAKTADAKGEEDAGNAPKDDE